MKSFAIKSVLKPALGFSLFLSVSAGVIAEEPKTPPVKTETPVVDKKEPVKADEKKPELVGDPFIMPLDADANALVAYCKNLFGLRKGLKTRPEFMQYQARLFPAVKIACEKILELEKSDKTENGRFARRNLLSMGMRALMGGSQEEIKKYLTGIQEFAESQPPAREDVGMIAQTIQGVEATQGEKGLPFIQAIAAILKKSSDAMIVEYAKSLDGLQMRLGLVGKSMELKGKKLDGKDFDLTSLKGKVVLVDFWATWCGPCLQELPSLKTNYEAYHSKGFEIVGISGDQDRAALDKFLSTEKLPWIMLHEEGGQSEAMKTYSISAFPTTILVGKDGKVIALGVNSSTLGGYLKDQLGEPETPKAVPEKK